MFDVVRLPLVAKLKTYPKVFLPIARLRDNAKRQVVHRDTDICIEGFWRCGNHFATYAFMVAQPQPLKVAHHFHAPAQLMLAGEWGVPAVLLIREPVDAVASSTVYFEREDPGLWLKLYNTFHTPLVNYAPRLIVSDFRQTVGDFGSVIDAVNNRYSRNFRRFDGTREQRDEVEQLIRREHQDNMGASAATLPLPSEQKARVKERVLERMYSTSNATLLRQSQDLYEALKSHSAQPAGLQCSTP